MSNILTPITPPIGHFGTLSIFFGSFSFIFGKYIFHLNVGTAQSPLKLFVLKDETFSCSFFKWPSYGRYIANLLGVFDYNAYNQDWKFVKPTLTLVRTTIHKLFLNWAHNNFLLLFKFVLFAVGRKRSPEPKKITFATLKNIITYLHTFEGNF